MLRSVVERAVPGVSSHVQGRLSSFDYLGAEDEDVTIFRNVGNYSHRDTASHS